jgi:hypothetical protein
VEVDDRRRCSAERADAADHEGEVNRATQNVGAFDFQLEDGSMVADEHVLSPFGVNEYMSDSGKPCNERGSAVRVIGPLGRDREGSLNFYWHPDRMHLGCRP